MTRTVSAIVGLVFVTMAIAGLVILVREWQELRLTVSSAGWTVAKANEEYLDALASLRLAQATRSPADYDAARLNVDILWNRLSVLGRGDEAADVREMPGFQPIIGRLTSILERLDPMLQTLPTLLSPEGTAVVAELDRLRPEMTELMKVTLHRIMDAENPSRLILYHEWVLVSAFGALASGLVLIIMLTRELRARQRMASEADAARTQAEAASRAKDSFLAAMSHELRTPLNAIMGFAEFMLARPYGTFDDRYTGQIESIHTAGKRLLHVIGELLDVSRIASGQTQPTFETVDITELSRNCLSLVGGLAETRNIRIATSLDLGPTDLQTDAKMVTSIVTNLLANAVKFSPENSTVVFRLSTSEGAGLCIRVLDEGPGIAPADREKVRQAFVRLENSYTRTTEGTGLGLHLVQSYAELLGGSLQIDDNPSGGAAITVRLPPVPVRVATGQGRIAA